MKGCKVVHVYIRYIVTSVVNIFLHVRVLLCLDKNWMWIAISIINPNLSKIKKVSLILKYIYKKISAELSTCASGANMCKTLLPWVSLCVYICLTTYLFRMYIIYAITSICIL